MTIRTTYSIGDEVYILNDYSIVRARIVGVDVQLLGSARPHILYRFVGITPREQRHVFPSENALLQYLQSKSLIQK